MKTAYELQLETANARKAQAEAFPNFIRSVRSTFLEGALWKYYGTVLEKCDISSAGKNIGRSVLENYIKENGVDRLLFGFKEKSYALSEINRLVNKVQEGVMDTVDEENPESFAVTPEEEKKFYDELSNNDNFDDITNSIRMRVIDAEEKMSTDNIKDKLDSEEIMRNAAQRIEAVKSQNAIGDMDDETSDAIQKEAAITANAEIGRISYNRSRSVLEQLVRSMSEEVLKEGALNEAYAPNGNINYDKLIESCKVAYAFIEMCNTMKMEEFDEAAVLNLVK